MRNYMWSPAAYGRPGRNRTFGRFRRYKLRALTSELLARDLTFDGILLILSVTGCYRSRVQKKG